jgi:hypothetical protein
VPVEDMKSRLLGKHVQIHKLDFEIQEKEDATLQITPHTEQVEAIKTLPVTDVEFQEKGDNTNVTLRFKLRATDAGGPYLLIVFCFLMLIVGSLFYTLGDGKKEYSTTAWVMFGISALTFVVFWLRMETGYFDYIRKIRSYVKKQTLNPA